MSALPPSIARRLRLPLIAAPMFLVSGPDLVIAACRAGVIGSFPTANCRTVDELEHWLDRINTALTPQDAPFCPNLIMRREDLRQHLDCLLRHKVEMVITSVGSPQAVVGPLHDIGCLVFADVASVQHARKAIAAGVDGLILLTAGAGGQTGWANGFAFARAVREFFSGPMVLAGGIADGQALWAAQVLGCDLAYMGTKFIATRESLATTAYREMLVRSSVDDILLTTAVTGLETNMLRPSLEAAGLDPAQLSGAIGQEPAAMLFASKPEGPSGASRWRDIWSAGHSVSGVRAIGDVSELVNCTRAEYEAARAATQQLMTFGEDA
ncbi:nitronate monooxygenase family protein [Janthinobacterium sp. PC23-8]|uniref:NAD(P)H-dependent flavin oxidoreductase n=1 Tax=Janthinobacterium sp. PC23-8 TaxID=2012679 RepID=UPI000B970FF9|nr:nitronate monooxygenase [Janthinobacterium sp. PC23-8]OYO26310.1 2-nitropropane dioxygenase [Janthinobacterium sp. PC23-8]